MAETPTSVEAEAPRRSGAGAILVGAGILLSRVFGLVRQRVFGHFLGTSAAADAYTAALRIPNFLQNLLGEGVLSASFIPVYASLKGDEARRVAGAIAGLLGVVTGLFTLGGIAATPLLIDLIAPGFTGDTRALAVRLVQIFFPGVALLVASAFCLGVLNSHRRFFLSYAAPVLWNAAIIAALIYGGVELRLGPFPLAVAAAWGMVAGSALQLAVQVPSVLRLLGGPRAALGSLSLGRKNPHASAVVRSFLPVLAGRGVVQISAYVDTFIASWLPVGALASIQYAQTIYLLPISLFGMSVSAAALPEMSEQRGEALRAELERGLRRIAFTVVPTAVGFVALGDVICAALYQTGRFGPDDVRFAAAILAGYTLGLLASTSSRLYSSSFYALRDTRTPLRFAAVRVAVSSALGAAAALWLPGALRIEARWGAVGLAVAAALGAWLELWLLRRRACDAVGPAGSRQWQLWASALLAAAAAWGVRLALPEALRRPWPQAALVLGAFGGVYFAAALALRVPEARAMLERIQRRRR